MDKKKLEKYKEQLEEAKLEITRASGSADGPDQETQGRDQADLASTAELLENQLALSKVEREQLREIESALARLKNGNYGTCTECKQPIPEKRLKALPHATLCVECKAKLETANNSYNYERTRPEPMEVLDEGED